MLGGGDNVGDFQFVCNLRPGILNRIKMATLNNGNIKVFKAVANSTEKWGSGKALWRDRETLAVSKSKPQS